ncbi:MAG TPA: shikimate dehydrogenase [Coleofasciculaceae cyanobacterium]
MSIGLSITGTTQLLGVIGHPVEHSLSPVMHNAAIAELGVNYAYLPLPVSPENLASAIAGFEAIGLQGFNVTIPHKQAIMPLLSEVSELAKAIGAVNTVYRTAEEWGGTNTDVIGFLAPLLEHPASLPQRWKNSTAVILGNGGAARAVVAGCHQLGCAHIQVVGRSFEKLQAFQQSWGNAPLSAHLSVHTWENLPFLLRQADLLVNTTPIGMYPHGDASPLAATELAQLPSHAIVYDLIYRPRPTLLLQQAQAQGCSTFDGLEMLVQQGAAALQIWLQQPVPVDSMRRSLLENLKFT